MKETLDQQVMNTLQELKNLQILQVQQDLKAAQVLQVQADQEAARISKELHDQLDLQKWKADEIHKAQEIIRARRIRQEYYNGTY